MKFLKSCQLLAILSLVLALYSSCSTYNAPFLKNNTQESHKQLPDSDNLKYTIHLIGDAGGVDNVDEGTNYVVDAVKSRLNLTGGDKEAVVYLGDNVYPQGLHSKKHPDRDLEEKILRAQLDIVKENRARAYFIPGNHDWKRMKKGGRKAVLRQEDFIHGYYDKKHKARLLPKNACGDPEVVKVGKNLVLLFIDSQWWLHNWDREKKMNKGCEMDSRREFIDEIQDIFIKYKNKQVVVFLHHSIFSNGNHGGNFSLKQHLFPLEEKTNGLYLPLPIIGSIYPLYRQLGGTNQDIANEDYQMLLSELQTAASVAKHVIFASGHEHLLQYNYAHENHFIVSGSGSRVAYSQGGRDAEFVYSHRGFTTLNFYDNGEVWMDINTVSPVDGEKLQLRKLLVKQKAGTEEIVEKYPSSAQLPKTVIAAANENFAAGGFKELLLGQQYRDMWATPLEVSVVDLDNTLGGLTPIKKGGGMSSNSLRMETNEGRHYILRSINKDYRKLVPESWRNLKAINIMKDQNSASHPYGALVIPTLSKAANIYYTTPKLVYLKKQEALGAYNDLFPEELYLLEERPAGDWSGHEAFGNSSDIIGYNALLDRLRSKINHHIDQKWVLKSRLFDMWIHDWDRHDDQWRWASFKEDGKTIYRPIPRDRDQAFYKFIGIIPKLVSMGAMRQFKTFDDEISDVPGLCFNAKHFDRFFLNGLSWPQWESVVKELQSDITEDDIKDAMKAMPHEVRDMEEKDMVRKLKKRKKDLKKYARELYEYINEGVDIVGTDHDDIFKIDRQVDGTTRVSHHIKKKKEKILRFDRVLEPSVVNEIRIFGLDGKDKFEITGDSKNAIKLRIVGGLGKDKLENNSTNPGSNKVYLYDELDGIKIDSKKHILDKRSDDLESNEYDRKQFKYDISTALVSASFTQDDGFWLGYSASHTKHGFRKNPFKTKHSYGVSFAPGSRSAIKVHYASIFNDVINDKISLLPSAFYSNPNYINYFGRNNDLTASSENNDFNWVRISSYGADLKLGYNWSGEKMKLTFGPEFESNKLQEQEDRVLDESNEFTDVDLERKNYVGAGVGFTLESKDRNSKPTRGVSLNIGGNWLEGFDGIGSVQMLHTDLSFFLPVMIKPQLVLGTHLGYSKSWGDTQVYHLLFILHGQ